MLVAVIGAALGAVPVSAQRALSLESAIREATGAGPAASLARADSILAAAGLTGARAFPDPILTTGYTEDAPRYHAELEQPLDLIARSARVTAARAGTAAASLRLSLAYAVIRRDVTAAYVRASAAARRLRLSERAAADAAELVRIATLRRDAGDASDLDVGLARLSAGDLDNRLQADSIDALNAGLELQLLLGQQGTTAIIAPSDSLELLRPAPVSTSGRPLATAVAEAESRTREADVAFRRRERFPTPILRAGFDTWDPATGSSKVLPTLGIAFTVPFLDRNRGALAEARAGAMRAAFELAAADRASEADIARAEREREAASTRLGRDRLLVGDAERMAVLVTTAYSEGAYPLASVLEAQRTVRETLTRYIDDLTAFLIATADYALATESR
jgi:outer membrane protein, heavy metal efflux system